MIMLALVLHQRQLCFQSHVQNLHFFLRCWWQWLDNDGCTAVCLVFPQSVTCQKSLRGRPSYPGTTQGDQFSSCWFYLWPYADRSAATCGYLPVFQRPDSSFHNAGHWSISMASNAYQINLMYYSLWDVCVHFPPHFKIKSQNSVG